MKKSIISLWFILSCISVFASNPDIELLRKRFEKAALQPEREVRIDYVKERMQKLQDDGTWPDINYVDVRNVAFQHVEHLNHMVEMARAYRLEDSSLKGDSILKAKLFSAIDHWTTNDYKCNNWWNNEIGTPTELLKILYIMDEELGKERAQKMLTIIGRANIKAQGARPSGDRMKIASLYTKTKLWERNDKEVARMILFMGNEMKYYDDITFNRIQKENPQYFKGGRGLQADFSFHHRDDRVNNTLTYGEGHAAAFVEWASAVYDTRYKIKEPTIKLMVDFYLDGMCKQMAFGKQSDPGVMNRDMARPNTGKQLARNDIAESLIKITNYRKAELENFIAIRKGEKAEIPAFAKTFFNSDYFVCQRPNWYASVRMYSKRSASMEMPYNGEGITNHYRGDGANYITVSGDEYTSIYPTFNFRMVPGTTTVQAEKMPDEELVQQKGLTDFVGGVDDTKYGAAAFDFVSPIDGVSAKKSWFFFDDFYVALGAGIHYEGEGEVYTTINQTYLNGKIDISDEQEYGLWLHHDSIAYVFPKGGIYNCFSGAVDGSWKALNKQTSVPKKEIRNDMFTLYLNHGEKPKKADYAYMVIPGVSVAKTKEMAEQKYVQINSNTTDLQSVVNRRRGIAMGALYKGGRFFVSEKIIITSKEPCMLLVRYNDKQILELMASDPTQKLQLLHLNVKAFGKTRNLVVKMPKGQLAGASVLVL